MLRQFYPCRWTKDELHGKRIQFRLTAPSFWVEGFGLFDVFLRGDLVSIIIRVPSDVSGDFNVYHLYDSKICSKIEVHPDPTVADFQLLA
jgi:hypothetical protein